jgi:hypothetical protein
MSAPAGLSSTISAPASRTFFRSSTTRRRPSLPLDAVGGVCGPGGGLG